MPRARRSLTGRRRRTVVLPNTPIVPNGVAEDDDHMEEPPRKRMRYVPGGRGGGGRHVLVDGTTIDAFGTPQASARSTRARAQKEDGKEESASPVYSRPRRRPTIQPRYSTATSAVAAVTHNDGYKPREERSWEEMHPDLDLDRAICLVRQPPVELSREQSTIGISVSAKEESSGETQSNDTQTEGFVTTPGRRRLGRPTRDPNFYLNGLLSPRTPRTIPSPAPNPREVLMLPRPSFKHEDPFEAYEMKGNAQVNFVDRSMASVGYQESEMFLRPDRQFLRSAEGTAEEDLDLIPSIQVDGENAAIGSLGVGRVEYDMDEQDFKWLDMHNSRRKNEQAEAIKPAIFEITMTKIEKEWHALEKRIPKPNPKPPQTQRPRSSSAAAVNGEPGPGEEQDTKCAICDDGDCENANAIVFCDGCDLAVHQECYGVPYIPEGQWLCRKCQLLGRGAPTCIFCPNTEGAFKQTNSAKWSHLLCALWIPEVTLGNPSLQEPVNDVEKVPPARWKLTCYICLQKMGACIQCSNKNCYEAFHLTCARRAHLQLKMKAGPGPNSILEKHQLRALCHRHVSPEWRLEHDTDNAIADAKKFYHQTMRHRRWADSQASALSLGANHADITVGAQPRLTLTAGGNKRNRIPKSFWRLPSGSTLVPDILAKSIEGSLQRFNIRRKKEFVTDICRYWTLKRESRRGAALLKRLQLQMDTFSSMEITRRDYVSMGAVGRGRLERRIQFAELLLDDMQKLHQLTEMVKERERQKLEDALLLKSVVDTLYFPIPPLIWPILQKAIQFDSKGIYEEGFSMIRRKLELRLYTSMTDFSTDLTHVFSSQLGVESTSTVELQEQMVGRAHDMSLELREKRKLAKRIIRAVQPAIDDAFRKESELSGRPFEKQMRDLDQMLDNTIMSRRDFIATSVEDDVKTEAVLATGDRASERKSSEPGSKHVTTNGIAHIADVNKNSVANGHVNEDQDTSVHDVSMDDAEALERAESIAQLHGELSADTEMILATHTPPASTDGIKKTVDEVKFPPKKLQDIEPPTPPMSFEGNQQASLAFGGVMWYVEQFDPVGTTVHEERWTGPDVLRAMSEELSEMGDDELHEMADGYGNDASINVNGDVSGAVDTDDEKKKGGQLKKNGKPKRKWRGFR